MSQQPQQAQQPTIIVQNAVNIGGRRRRGLGFHIFMFFITGGLWLFIAPFLAMRKSGASNSVRM
ncbi:hypothetical protein ACN26Y_02470 [Micromonospora sp. WMMD558]|uniref:hypothetical protein n=1 Tax=Micromonospora sp. WMMD558 TaxID=3403462 RepID=UPI003BF55614